MAASTGFRLLTLGTLRLIGPDGADEPSLLARRRKLSLLALLAITQQPMGRDRLASLFWSEQEEERARHSLSDALSSLRKALGPNTISARREQVELDDLAPLQVDLRELAEAAKAREWARVVALHRGPFLEGVPLAGSSAWEHWVLAQRAGAARLFATACRHESERLAGVQQWEALGALTARWVADAPSDATAATWHLTAVARHAPEDPETAFRVRDAYDDIARRALSASGLPPDRLVTARRDALLEELRRVRGLPPERPAPPSLQPEPESPTSSEIELPPTPVPPPTVRRRGIRRMAATALAGVALAGVALAGWGITRSLPATEAGAALELTTASPEARALLERAMRGSAADISRQEALTLIDRALELDSSFAMAHRTRALLLEGDGSRAAAVSSALTRAAAEADRVTPFERALILSSYHLLVTGDYTRAATAQRELLRLAPRDGDAWHDLGMTYQYLGDDARAAAAYRSALQRDPSSASTWANLVDAVHASAGDAATDAVLDSMGLAIPGHRSNFSAAARVRMARMDWSGAETQARAYLAASPDSPRAQAIGELLLSRTLWGQGRLDDGDAAARRGVAWWAATGDSVMALRESIALSLHAVWARDDVPRARRLLRDGLARFPVRDMASADRPSLELAMAHALTGAADDATRTLAEYLSAVSPVARRRAAGTEALARGTLAMAEGRLGDAEEWLRQASRPDCSGCGLPELGLVLEVRGDTAGARTRYERFLATRSLRRTDLLDALHREWVTNRLAGTGSAWSPTLRP